MLMGPLKSYLDGGYLFLLVATMPMHNTNQTNLKDLIWKVEWQATFSPGSIYARRPMSLSFRVKSSKFYVACVVLLHDGYQ